MHEPGGLSIKNQSSKIKNHTSKEEDEEANVLSKWKVGW
jgi:hypothetical protein